MAHRLRGLLLVPALFALVACVSIPESGSVTTRSAEAHPQHAPGFIHAFAQKASPGMTEEQVARGFLLAQVDPDHGAALSYLTTEEADRWNPGAKVVILTNDDPPTVAAVGADGQWKFSGLPQDGVISEEGDYTATPGATASGFLRLVRQDGEWRIAEAPDGLYLSPDDFVRNYAVYNTYFIEPGARLLVPNPVYLPVDSTQSTSLVQRLLSGPAPWLSASVRTAFPPGTALTAQSAPIHDNVVQVDLTEQVLQASADDIRLLAAQLAWTLGQLGVKGVRITSGGVPLPGLANEIDRSSFTALDPSGTPSGSAVAVVDNQVVTLGRAGEKPEPLAGVIGSGRIPLIDPAISAVGDRAAALDPTGKKLYVGTIGEGAPLRLRVTARDLVPPSFDPFGDVWTAGLDKTGSAIWVVSGGDGGVRRVVTPDLGKRRVTALRIARDGVRAAVVLDHRGHGELYVGRIVRSATDVTLEGLHRVEAVLVDVKAVAWENADSILALDGSQPYLVGAFGVVTPTGGSSLPDITAVTAAPQQVILASTKAGKIFSTDGTDAWVSVRKGQTPSYPG